MEIIAPLLRILMFLRRRLLAGESVRTALQRLSREFAGPDTAEILNLIQDSPATRGNLQAAADGSSHYRRELVAVLRSGLGGEPILLRLEQLEQEFIFECRDQMERHLQRLPVMALGPLLFLLFPAFMLLLIGPLVLNLMEMAAS